MFNLIKEMAVVKRRDLIDRLTRIKPIKIELLTSHLSKKFDDSVFLGESGEELDFFDLEEEVQNEGLKCLDDFKRHLDTNLPSSKYSKYEDVIYNWAVDHQNHSIDDLSNTVKVFDLSYVNKLRKVNKKSTIFSTSLKDSLTLNHLYEIINSIDETERYEYQEFEGDSEDKYDAIGIYPVYADFKNKQNLDKFIYEFLVGEHKLMVVKPTTTKGSIFWAKASFENIGGTIEAYDVFENIKNHYNEEEQLDFNYAKLITQEKNHSHTVPWCTSTKNVGGNAFMLYSGGQNKHLYYTFNAYKDKTDDLRRFCTGLLSIPGQSILKRGKDETGSDYVDSRNSTFSLNSAIKEWKKESGLIAKTIDIDLSKNKNTVARENVINTKYEDFLDKITKYSSKQSMVYKDTISRTVSNIDPSELSGLESVEDIKKIKGYFDKERAVVYQCAISEQIKKINESWSELLSEENITVDSMTLNINNKKEDFSSSESIDLFSSMTMELLLKCFFNTMFMTGHNDYSGRESVERINTYELYNILNTEIPYEDEIDLDIFTRNTIKKKSGKIHKEKRNLGELSNYKKAIFRFMLQYHNKNKSSYQLTNLKVLVEALDKNWGFSKCSYLYDGNPFLSKDIDEDEKLENFMSTIDIDSIDFSECKKILASLSNMSIEDTIENILYDKEIFNTIYNSMQEKEPGLIEKIQYNRIRITRPIEVIALLLIPLRIISNKFSRLNEKVEFDESNLNRLKESEDYLSFYSNTIENLDQIVENSKFKEFFIKEANAYINAFFFEDLYGNYYGTKLFIKRDRDTRSKEEIINFATEISCSVEIGLGDKIKKPNNTIAESLREKFFTEKGNPIEESNKAIKSRLNSLSNTRGVKVDDIDKEYFIRNYNHFIKSKFTNSNIKKCLKEIIKNTSKEKKVFTNSYVSPVIVVGYAVDALCKVILDNSKLIKDFLSTEEMNKDFGFDVVISSYRDHKGANDIFNVPVIPKIKTEISRVIKRFILQGKDQFFDEQAGPEGGVDNTLQDFAINSLVDAETKYLMEQYLPWKLK